MERIHAKKNQSGFSKFFYFTITAIVFIFIAVTSATTMRRLAWVMYSPHKAGSSSVEFNTLRRGMDLLEKGYYAEASEFLDESLRQNPSSYMAYYGKGRIDFCQGNLDSALKNLEKSTNLNPEFAPAQLWIGKVYRFRKDYNKAISYYKKALSLDSNYADAYCHLGYAHYYLGNESDSLNNFNKSISLNPTQSVAYFGKARILTEREDNKEAEENFTLAIKNDPNYAEAYQQRGILYAGTLRYKKALSDLNYAIKLEPNNISSIRERGTILLWIGKFEEALTDFKKAEVLEQSEEKLEFKKDFIGYLLLEKGLALFKLGKIEEGRKLIKEGIDRIKPSDEDEDWDLIGYGYMALGQNNKAFNYFNKYHNGDLHHALYGRAIIYLERGQKEKALNYA
jgi:tetratricopeptide (TPR) repeat protein